MPVSKINLTISQAMSLIHGLNMHLLISRFSQAAVHSCFGIFHHLLKLSEALEDKIAWISVSPYFELSIRFWLVAI